MERLLLIGGTGHLGFAIVNKIYNCWKNNEIFITVLTRNNHLPNYFPKNSLINFQRYDPKNINTIKKCIQDIKPTSLIYLASDNNNNDSADFNISSEVNLFIPIKILFLIKEINCDIKYIFLSSKLSNLDSNDYCLYSLNKYFAEEYIKKFSYRYNLNCTSIKLPTLFGPGDFSKVRLISSYIQGILKNKKVIINDDLEKKITIVSSKEISNLLLEKILNNDKNDFNESVKSIQFTIAIGQLLRIIDLIHKSNSFNEDILYLENFKNTYIEIKDYEILYEQLVETYNFLYQNINLI